MRAHRERKRVARKRDRGEEIHRQERNERKRKMIDIEEKFKERRREVKREIVRFFFFTFCSFGPFSFCSYVCFET